MDRIGHHQGKRYEAQLSSLKLFWKTRQQNGRLRLIKLTKGISSDHLRIRKPHKYI
jgi:hypothetical protein